MSKVLLEPIEKIIPTGTGRDKEYLIKTGLEARGEGKTRFRLNKVSGNPKFLILRGNKAIATCTERYVPVPNKALKRTALEVFEDVGYQVRSENKTPIGKHAMIQSFILKDDYVVENSRVTEEDRLQWGIALSNSYDLSMGLNVMERVWRMICSNGMYGWGWGKTRRHTHFEKGHDKDEILARVGNSIRDVLDRRDNLASKFMDSTNRDIDPMLVERLLSQLEMRKYECKLLEGHGIFPKWKEGKVDSVKLDEKIMSTEYDLINAITNVAKQVKTVKRQVELEQGIMERVQGLRIRIVAEEETNNIYGARDVEPTIEPDL